MPSEPTWRVPLESIATLEYHRQRWDRLPVASGQPQRRHRPVQSTDQSRSGNTAGCGCQGGKSKMMTFSKAASYSRLAAATLALVCTAFTLQASPARAETTLTVVDGIDV